jgi:hypothetical protein
MRKDDTDDHPFTPPAYNMGNHLSEEKGMERKEERRINTHTPICSDHIVLLCVANHSHTFSYSICTLT